MEKKYIAPEMEIIKFLTEDIIVASGGSGEGGSEDVDDGND